MKKTKEIGVIHSFVINHIKNLKKSGSSRLDKEIDYELLKEAVEALIREYKVLDDSRQKKEMKKVIINVYDEIYAYLVKINKYDHKMLELYDMLDCLLYNRKYYV